MTVFDGSTRIYGVPLGVDFASLLARGLIAHTRGAPERLARTTLLLNTRRLERRMRDLFDAHMPCLLPRIDLVTDLRSFPAVRHIPPPGSDIRRFLRMTQVMEDTLRRLPNLAHPSAAVDLAKSVGAVLDEMEIEGTPLDALRSVPIETQSEHWDRARQLLEAFGAFLADDPDPGGKAAYTRLATDSLIASWKTEPPADPVILAGSTGSRGTTFDLMRAIAGLPNGIVILPGFDFDLPATTWEALLSDRFDPVEDHPQYRFARFLAAEGLTPRDVQPLDAGSPETTARRALVSLSLRPAPVTDAWLAEGPGLGPLASAVDGLTLLEADSSRDEAEAIALVLRDAVEHGKTAAVITQNRTLTRRITSALDRWRIVPDDSAGEPLAQTPPGRLVLQIAALPETPIPSEDGVALLKHPLVALGEARGTHLRFTRELELWLRRNAIPLIDAPTLTEWLDDNGPPDAKAWSARLAQVIEGLGGGQARVPRHAEQTIAICQRLAKEPDVGDASGLWEDEAGIAARSVLEDLHIHGAEDHVVTRRGWQRILDAAIRAEEVRDAVITDPRVMFWGPLEARVQGADLVIIAGLNEGTWPETPSPDPWLNRAMRRSLGLLSPERSVGLAAHDFQSAVTSREVVLTRSLQEDGAVTVPSRWLSRLTNLLQGLPATEGPDALASMQNRGRVWLSHVATMRRVDPVPPEPRPAPRPPVDTRPKRLSVTAIERLIRDPYAIYATHVLGLRKLRPLRQESDPALRGQILHEIFDRFTDGTSHGDATTERERLLHLSAEVLARRVPWPTARRLWQARISRIADAFIAWEIDQRVRSIGSVAETKGRMSLPEIDFSLEGRADRITRLVDGTLEIIDYKTGKAPTRQEVQNFDRQLVLEALIAEAGGFENVEAAPVSAVTHIGLSPDFALSTHPVGADDDVFDLTRVRRELIALIAAYQSADQGYAARRAMASVRFDGDFDHLARYGEWDDEARPVPVTLK